ncbi:MAG: hypothetical protein EOO54_02115 [Haliea sp.]|nr:MAG: hypothetical protein EOO54_02115 [Haliea sp.]
MASPQTLKRLDALIWVLIFGGLITLSLGLPTHSAHVIAGWSLTAVGGLAAAAGVTLIWVRSRLHGDANHGNNS